MKFPIRINKYLAERGISTRRGGDTLIEKGFVFINNKKAKLGDKVNEKDIVRIENENKLGYVYYAYYKPTGIVTVGAQGNEKEIKDVIPLHDVFPVGRLDKETHGLIILTNDGRVTKQLLDHKLGYEKEYSVIVDKAITHTFLMNMLRGVDIKGSKTKRSKIRKVNQTMFEIVLTEGKNRQIRRMCEALGFQVRDLKRFRIENIELEKMKAGQYRKIDGKELSDFLRILKIK